VILPVDPAGIPAELRRRPWVLWSAEPDPSGGKLRKVPRRIAYPDRNASSTDAATWGTFEDAITAYDALTSDPHCAGLLIAGVGVVLVGDGLVCVDLDHCIQTDGALTPNAARVVAMVLTWTEVSASGDGLHLWVQGALDRAFAGDGIEAYYCRRYIAVTGQRWRGTPESVEPAPRLITTLNRLSAPAPSPTPARPTEQGPAGIVRRLAPIPEGTRDNTLFRLAAGLVAEGTRGPALLSALSDANTRLCVPPLRARDVERIARSASRGQR